MRGQMLPIQENMRVHHDSFEFNHGDLYTEYKEVKRKAIVTIYDGEGKQVRRAEQFLIVEPGGKAENLPCQTEGKNHSRFSARSTCP